jgi:hypothetical protein
MSLERGFHKWKLDPIFPKSIDMDKSILQIDAAVESRYNDFKLFLSTAPTDWNPSMSIKRFQLPNRDFVSCVLWNELFHITGTDIVKCLAFRFECLGRIIVAQKKFEEGIFSDLRNLKPIQDATLEPSRSDFLRFLHENNCIRTQKKQKVFYWFSVNHDKLFLVILLLIKDALERDLKRQANNQETCTVSKVPMSVSESLKLAKTQLMANLNSSISVPSPYRSSSYIHTVVNTSDNENFDSEQIQSNQDVDLGKSPNMQLHDSPKMNVHIDEKLDLYRSTALQDYHDISSISSLNTHEYGYIEPLENYSLNKNERPFGKMDHRPIIQGNHYMPYYPYNRSFSDKILKCPFTNCGKVFKRQEHLRRHYLSHTGEKPYKCSYPNCYRSFIQREELNQHLEIHSQLHWDSPALYSTEKYIEDDYYLREFTKKDELTSESLFGQSDLSESILNQQADSLLSDLASLDPEMFPNISAGFSSVLSSH